MRRILQRGALALVLLLASARAAGAEALTWDAAGPFPDSHAALHDEVVLGPRTLELGLHVHEPAAASTRSLRGEGRVEADLALGARLVARQLYGIGADGHGVVGPSQLRLLAPRAGRLEGIHAYVGSEPDLRREATRTRLGAGAALRLGLGTSASLELEHARIAASSSERGRLGLAWQTSLESRIGVSMGVTSTDGLVSTAAGLQLDHRF